MGRRIVLTKKLIKRRSTHLLAILREQCKTKSIVLMANGPSLAEVDLSPLLDYRDQLDFMWINRPCEQIRDPEYWAWADPITAKKWDKFHRRFKGYHITSTSRSIPMTDKTVRFKLLSPIKFALNPKKGLSLGASTLFLACQVTNWMLYKKIYMFGCDLSYKTVHGKQQAYFDAGRVPISGLRKRQQHFARESKSFQCMRDLPVVLRHKYVWCSSQNPHKWVDELFIRYPHETAVQQIITDITGLREGISLNTPNTISV